MVPLKSFLRPAVYILFVFSFLFFQHDLRGQSSGGSYCQGPDCLEQFKPVVYMYCDDDLPLSLDQIKHISSTERNHYDINDRRYHSYKVGGCNSTGLTGTVYGKAVSHNDGDEEYLFLQYWFLYSCSKLPLGYDWHEGDVEMFQVVLKKKNGKWTPLGLDLSQHHDAEFVPWHFKSHTPVVYVAKGSHAIYASPGSHQAALNLWFHNDELVAMQKAGYDPLKNDRTCGSRRDSNQCTRLDYRLVYDNNEANKVFTSEKKLGKSGIKLAWSPPDMPLNRKWGRKEGIIMKDPLGFHKYASRIKAKTTMASSKNLSIAMILDRSGSMSKNDPRYLRVKAAEMFLNMSNSKDRFAVVLFESAPVNKYEEWGGNSLDVEGVKRSIRDVKPRGGTDIGKALTAAYNALNNDTSGKAKAALLLTDGRGDYNNEADAFVKKGWPIYTIGLSKNVNKKLLYKISSLTGGDYIPASEAIRLFKMFIRAHRQIKGIPSILEYDGTINPGETQIISFNIDPESLVARCFLTWAGSNLDMTLISPSGRRFSPQGLGKVSDNYEMINIKPTEFGEWKAEIKAISVPSSGEPFHFQVIADSPLKPDIKGTKSSYQRGEPIRLALGMQGPSGKTNTPEVKVIGPDGKSRQVSVRSSTGGGFQTSGLRLQRTGDHEIEARFSGQTKGHKYTRMTSKVIYVGGEEYKGAVGTVTKVSGGYISVDIGEPLGLRPGIGIDCYSGRIGPSRQTAHGHIITVYPGYSDVEIDRTMGNGLIKVGDPCRLDEMDWKQD